MPDPPNYRRLKKQTACSFDSLDLVMASATPNKIGGHSKTPKQGYIDLGIAVINGIYYNTFR